MSRHPELEPSFAPSPPPRGSAAGAAPSAAAVRADLSRLGVTLVIVSLSMLFLAILGAFIVVRASSAQWPPEGVKLNLPLGLVNTLILAASSGALAVALRRARSSRPEAARLPLQLAGALAVGFLGLQGLQYHWLISNFGQTIASSQFGSYFYSLTGLHGLHVGAGLLWLLSLFPASRARNAVLVELCGLYWHFVTLLWGLLFVVLYLV